MQSSTKKTKLNPLQSKTLVLLQILAREADSSAAVTDSDDIRVTRLPHGHGNHMHVGQYVVSTKDASGLDNPAVWVALVRKGFVRENWQSEIIITAAGLAFTTGLESKFVSTSDH